MKTKQEKRETTFPISMIPPKDSTWYQPVHYHHCKIRLNLQENDTNP